MNALLPIDTQLFQESFDVVILDGDEGRQAVANFLAGDALELVPNYRGFVKREQLANVDMPYLDALAEQQRREGGAS